MASLTRDLSWAACCDNQLLPEAYQFISLWFHFSRLLQAAVRDLWIHICKTAVLQALKVAQKQLSRPDTGKSAVELLLAPVEL